MGPARRLPAKVLAEIPFSAARIQHPRDYCSAPSPSPSSNLPANSCSKAPAITTPSNPFYNLLQAAQNPNNVVSVVCSSLKRKEDCSYLDRLREQGLFSNFTSNDLTRVLLRCQSDSHAALAFFKWVATNLSIEPSVQNYCIIVHVLVWSKNFKKAMGFLLQLLELHEKGGALETFDAYDSLFSCTDDCNWNPIVFDMLVKAHLRRGMVEESFEAFEKMVSDGFVPNVITVNCLLNMLSRTDHAEKCWEVFEKATKIGLVPNTCTFNILTHVLCKEGDVDKVDEFLNRFEEEHGFDPDIVTYNMLVDSFCKKNRVKDAVRLYNIMYRRGVDPDLITYTTLMNGLCKGGNMFEAHKLFRLMVHRGFEPDVVSYNTLIHGYCAQGMMHEARSVVSDMTKNKVLPDDFTCMVMIKGYHSIDRMTSALNLTVELERIGAEISRDTYFFLILALCKEDRPFAAKSLLGQMSKRDIPLNEEIYDELIDSLCRSKFLDEALELKEEMESKKLRACANSYRAVVRTLCNSGRSTEAVPMLKEMVECDLPVDSETCWAMVDGLCREKKTSEAEWILSFFAKELRIFDTACYNAVVRTLCDEGADASDLIGFQERMARLGFAPSKISCKYVIDGMVLALRMRKTRSSSRGMIEA